MIKNIALVTAGVVIALVGIITLQPSYSPLQDIYKGYNHLQMYEDGSYVAETNEGQQEHGCIKRALCDD